MWDNEVGFIAKLDILMCKYEYSYIKGRQSEANLHFVRQNMRKLAKLLQYVRLKNSG